MKNFKVSSLEDALVVLEYAKEYDKQVSLAGGYDNETDGEEYAFYIQENFISKVYEFFYGLEQITDESIFKADIFTMTMWDYITDRINLEELLVFFKEEELIK
ncbi:hypothetical protein SAMN04487895_101730 [Paenibacillus sophorae]|uniref:Uncharacterized protein n=1 Tax=Paenibacillus sophorae TaxID=1333845 RepID=A0A1H8H1H3_9BACL|nr:hypothetical protein [Paenibacillus sophorae]QWU14419.1 hypothetical protein KP014_21155 [Paenibacillus sophorae]SEN50241.1 hypothetical protein SAMN04487895_101730 [Paenibacillus sophorae]